MQHRKQRSVISLVGLSSLAVVGTACGGHSDFADVSGADQPDGGFFTPGPGGGKPGTKEFQAPDSGTEPGGTAGGTPGGDTGGGTAGGIAGGQAGGQAGGIFGGQAGGQAGGKGEAAAIYNE